MIFILNNLINMFLIEKDLVLIKNNQKIKFLNNLKIKVINKKVLKDYKKILLYLKFI